ncbi:626_t:CDS:1 [Paraglomus brasilianum]|uniref:626_t:CDS:1 n=1 Tax=Paraglomus brasilianum TaxID=144538 RepID=A0A9N8VQY5_9GLOM|nr:626_t:CDS:1 [Paraglomus brasilianum]
MTLPQRDHPPLGRQWHLTCKVRQRNHTATWPHMIHERAARGFHRHLAAGSDGAETPEGRRTSEKKIFTAPFSYVPV